MLRHLSRITLPALVALGACSTAPAPLVSDDFGPTTRPSTPPQVDPDRPGHLQILVGQQWLDGADWDPVDEPLAFGLTFSHENPDRVLGFEAGLNFGYQSKDDLGLNFTAESTEIFFGLRKTFMPEQSFQPYIGGGLTLASVSAEIAGGGSTESDDDFSPAFYVHAGLRVPVDDTFGVGIDGRLVRGSNITLFDSSADLDYEQVGLFIDYRF